MSAPLQQEIGRTERVLNAVLVEHVLDGGPFASVTEWVAANVLATASLTSIELQRALAVRTGELRETLGRMSSAGLVALDGDSRDVERHGPVSIADRQTQDVARRVTDRPGDHAG